MPREGLQHRVQIRSDLKETYQVRKHTNSLNLTSVRSELLHVAFWLFVLKLTIFA